MLQSRALVTIAALISLVFGANLLAQEKPQQQPDEEAVKQALSTMQEAMQLRSDLATAVAAGTEKPEGALEKLRAAKSPSGMQLAREADYALAAIDLGQRLVLRHPTEAEVLFRAAEVALAAEVKRMPDDNPKTKALCLQKLALIRSNYLSQPEQAQADAAAAAKLQPQDTYLAQFGRTLQTQITAEKMLQQKEAAK